MQTKVRGIRIGTDTELDVKATRGGGLVVAQQLPKFALVAALGAGNIVQTVTAVAGTTTMPTVTALMTLWNGNTAKSLIIDRLFAWTEAYDAGTFNQFFLWVAIHGLITTAIANTLTIRGLRSGDQTYGGAARAAVGTTVVNDGWHPFGNSKRTQEGNVEGMSALDYACEGRIVLPPYGEMSLHVGVNDSNITANVGISWYEVALDLG